MTSPGGLFRRPFRHWLGFDVRTGVVLLLFFGLIRVVLVLQANVTGQYQAVSIVFTVMAILPWLLLTRAGRRTMGVVKPRKWRWMLPGFLAGAGLCIVLFAVFWALWGQSSSNAFAYIGATYDAVPPGVSDGDRAVYFIIFSMIAITFSPIGEELLYRGLAQEAFASRLGSSKAAFIDAGAFAVAHLAHFGIVFMSGRWGFLVAPAALWFAAMFAASLLFFSFRCVTGSVWGAVVTHAGFNLAMTTAIFYSLDVF